LDEVVDLGGLLLLLSLGCSLVHLVVGSSGVGQGLLVVLVFGLLLLADWAHELVLVNVSNEGLNEQIIEYRLVTASKPTHSKWYHSSHLSHPIICALSSAVLHKQYNFRLFRLGYS
jgi:hypothetical protein